MYVEIERYKDYFWVNNKKITGRIDFEKLTREEQGALIKKRKEFLNERPNHQRR
jgi:hypothetical protein